LAADYSCSITIRNDGVVSTCQEPITIVDQDDADGRAVVRVDMQSMQNWQCFKAVAVIYEPEGWVINVGNSPTNNGYGGDGTSFSNDSEMQIVVPTDGENGILSLYHNDYSDGPYPMMVVDDMISHFSVLELSIGDQYFYAENKGASDIKQLFEGHHSRDIRKSYKNHKRKRFCRDSKNVKLLSDVIYRLGGNDYEAGSNDFIYWIGINRVIGPTGNRIGSGIKKITLTVSTDACGS
jgi:hypothetical protein